MPTKCLPQSDQSDQSDQSVLLGLKGNLLFSILQYYLDLFFKIICVSQQIFYLYLFFLFIYFVLVKIKFHLGLVLFNIILIFNYLIFNFFNYFCHRASFSYKNYLPFHSQD